MSLNLKSQPNFKTKLSQFNSAASKAISVFTKTLNDLKSINGNIEREIDLSQIQIQELELYADELSNQKRANMAIIDKIESIIED